jgi:hypothetical protein
MSEPHPGRHLSDLEHKLRQLAPAGQVQRDEIMYRAGQASVPVEAAPSAFNWVWPVATVFMTLVSVFLGMLLVLVLRDGGERPPVAISQPPAESMHPPDVQDEPHPLPDLQPPGPVTEAPVEAFPHHEAAEYRQLKAQALRWGADSLPVPPPAGGGTGRPQSVRELSKSLAHELGDGP